MTQENIIIFDTTLRDGEQSPGCSMNIEEKLRMAKQLAKLGVDVIEAGFPIASPGDFEAVHQIAKDVQGPIICGLARANPKDIARCAQAVEPAKRRRIHTFISSSDIHLQYQLKKSREEVLVDAANAVKYARTFVDDVEFSAMDATRSDWNYLLSMFQVAIDNGAMTLNIPDTVGYTIPTEFFELVSFLKAGLKGAEAVRLSVHCHNDLGLAVANSLAAIQAGARQVECTVNGIGERAGNCSMEEIVMTLHVRKDKFGLGTGIVQDQIYPSSRLLTTITGMTVQPNKAIVGENAFAHESGIHQDGLLKNKLTYEIMTPELLGIPSNKMVLGKHSGRAAFRDKLKTLGYDMGGDALDKLFDEFKILADKKKNVYDEDIMALIDGQLPDDLKYQLVSLSAAGGLDVKPGATVALKINGQTSQASAVGDGTVDAVFQAIKQLTGFAGALTKYQVKSVTGGTDAIGEVYVTLEDSGRKVRATGAHTDVLVGSAMAFLQALNKLEFYKKPKDLLLIEP